MLNIAFEREFSVKLNFIDPSLILGYGDWVDQYKKFLDT